MSQALKSPIQCNWFHPLQVVRSNTQSNTYTIFRPVVKKLPVKSHLGLAIGTNVISNNDVLSVHGLPVE